MVVLVVRKNPLVTVWGGGSLCAIGMVDKSGNCCTRCDVFPLSYNGFDFAKFAMVIFYTCSLMVVNNVNEPRNMALRKQFAQTINTCCQQFKLTLSLNNINTFNKALQRHHSDSLGWLESDLA